MTSKTLNPTTAVARGVGSEIVHRLVADDVLDHSRKLAQLQTNYVARRTRPRPDIARLVAELGYLFSAKFEITNSGPNSEPKWTYEPGTGLRDAMRLFLTGVDQHRYGFDDAMVGAISRLKKLQEGK